MHILTERRSILTRQISSFGTFSLIQFKIPEVALFLRDLDFPLFATKVSFSTFVDPFCCLDSLLLARTFFSLSFSKMTVYSSKAPKTKIMQAITQHSIAVRPSA